MTIEPPFNGVQWSSLAMAQVLRGEPGDEIYTGSSSPCICMYNYSHYNRLSSTNHYQNSCEEFISTRMELASNAQSYKTCPSLSGTSPGTAAHHGAVGGSRET